MPGVSGLVATKESGSFSDLCEDGPAFAAWYEHALPKVFGFVNLRAGGDLSLTEEITSLAFLEAVRARHSFAGRADPVTWICSIARNRLVDHHRRQARDQARHLRLVVGDISEGVSIDVERVAVLTALDLRALEFNVGKLFGVEEIRRLQVRVSTFIPRIDTARLDGCGYRRSANIVFIKVDASFKYAETALYVVPKIANDKFHSRIRRVKVPYVIHC